MTTLIIKSIYWMLLIFKIKDLVLKIKLILVLNPIFAKTIMSLYINSHKFEFSDRPLL